MKVETGPLLILLALLVKAMNDTLGPASLVP